MSCQAIFGLLLYNKEWWGFTKHILSVLVIVCEEGNILKMVNNSHCFIIQYLRVLRR